MINRRFFISKTSKDRWNVVQCNAFQIIFLVLITFQNILFLTIKLEQLPTSNFSLHIFYKMTRL